MTTPPPHTTTVVTEIPDCDFCSQEGRKVPAYADSGIRGHSSWANMCKAHFDVLGRGLGLGIGQRYLLRGQSLGAQTPSVAGLLEGLPKFPPGTKDGQR